MDAINFGTECWFSPCTGTGPWVQADLENGLFSGGNGTNPANTGNNSAFVTAVLKNNGTTTYAIKGGNSQSGSLTTWYNGALPTTTGYAPMHQEGAIVLGTGGDNSNSSVGSFFEGVMTTGYPTDAADNAGPGQRRLRRLRPTELGATGIVAAGDKGSVCLDNNNAAATNGNKVQMWNCDGNSGAQNWTAATNGTVQIDGGCLDITGAKYVNGTPIEWWTCNGGANRQRKAKGDEQIMNPASGLCLDDPSFNTAEGTQLVLYSCNAGTNQQWSLPYRRSGRTRRPPATRPGRRGPPRPRAGSVRRPRHRPSRPARRGASCAAARTPRPPRRTPLAGHRRRRLAPGELDQPRVHVGHRPEHPARHRPGAARGAYQASFTDGTPYIRLPGGRHPVGDLGLHHDDAAPQRRHRRQQVQHDRHRHVVRQVCHQRGRRVTRHAGHPAASAVTTDRRSARRGAAADGRGSSAASTGSTSTAVTRRAAGSRARVSEPKPGPPPAPCRRRQAGQRRRCAGPSRRR